MDSTFLALIDSERVALATRKILHERLEETSGGPISLTEAQYETLTAVVNRMVPQSGEGQVEIAGQLDRNKSERRGNGWRYAALPPDELSLALGLDLMDETAAQRFGVRFSALDAGRQDALLAGAQAGELAWTTLDAALWFEELLSDAVEIYVSHPATMAAIGFDGFAFLPRWQQLGLNTAEAWEPEAK